MQNVKPARILLTGGSGFIGTNLVEHFTSRGNPLLNLDISAPRNLQHAEFWHKVDILDRQTLINEVRAFGPEICLHLAARTDLDESSNLAGYSTNIDGICNIIEAIRVSETVQRAVFASSQLVCKLGYVPRDEYDYCPSTLYGRSKAIGEQIVRAADSFCPIWTIIRPTSIWGPWFDVPYKSFYNAIRRNLYVHPFGVRTLKQWGFVGNTVSQVDCLISADPGSIHRKTFYQADYTPLELGSFANMVQSALGSRPIPSLPFWVLKITALAGDLFQHLGWKNPPLTSFRLGNIITSEIHDTGPLEQICDSLPYSIQEGIEMTVRWLSEHD